MNRAQLLERLLRAAEARGLPLAGRDGPTLTGHDADLVAAWLPWESWISFLADEVRAAGWTLLEPTRRGHVLIAFAVREPLDIGDSQAVLQIDIHRALTAHGLPVGDIAPILDCAPVIDGIRVPDRSALAELVGRERRFTAGPWWRLLFPAAQAVTRHPRLTVRIWAAKFADFRQSWRRPSGRFWAFSGPDGAGKSSLIAALAPLMERRLCRSVRVLHTRPFILAWSGRRPGEGRRADRLSTRPPPRPLESLARWLLAWADYRLAKAILFPLWLARGTWILADRWVLDYRIDPLIRGINLPAPWLARLAVAAPLPDGQFVLTAAPDILIARKGELDEAEANRQLAAYRAMAIDGTLWVDSNRLSPGDAAATVVRTMVDGAGYGAAQIAPSR